MPEAVTTCPILVMSGGYSRAIAPPFTIQKYLDGTSPLFIPISGELVLSTVEMAAGGSAGSYVLRAFFIGDTDLLDKSYIR
jgi:hypothetical protein